VKFSSDDLILEGTSGLQETPFANYYAQYIMDWGQNMIAEYRERKIPAWFGHTPNAPTLAGADFRVVQINTQINAAIDTTDVKNTAAEIQSVKSQIASLKNTIAAQKSEAQGISEQYAYNALQQQIETNTNDLNNLQTTYSTLVSSFQSIVRENSAVTTDPKYHIRGFFDIPEFKYTDDTQSKAEEIIGFDIAYRYIKEDSTATQLNTFTYTSIDGTEHTGTFTDWIVEQGPLKTKVLDSESGQFVWKAENIADGTETNINQIDIAINKGEKVEIKVRSISEAGYPSNPLRSDWSESVIMEFPSTLATGNQISDLIEEVNSDALVLTVQNKLDALGVTTHLDDTVANKNSVTGLYFKHLSENIAYEQETTDSSGNVTVQSISVQKKLDDLALLLNALNTQTKNIQQTTDDTVTLVNQKTTQYDEEIYDLSTSLSRIGNNISDLSAGLNSALSVNRDDQGTYHPKLQAERYTFMDSTA
jgi:predicted  nucleic acid-binding Zn-ribbon protein